MVDDAEHSSSALRGWCTFRPWEEDELIASYIIPHVETVARTHRWLWHEGRCYLGLAPRAEESS